MVYFELNETSKLRNFILKSQIIVVIITCNNYNICLRFVGLRLGLG